jgi:protein O-GlcNAc transferase
MTYDDEIKRLRLACANPESVENQQTLAALADGAYQDVGLCAAILLALEPVESKTLFSKFCCMVAERCCPHRAEHGVLKREFELYSAACRVDDQCTCALLELGNISSLTGQCVSSFPFYEKAVAAALAANQMGLAEQAYGGWAKALAALGEIEKALEIMETASKETANTPPHRSCFWSSAYLMLLNYSDTRPRDTISALHLEWGTWLRESVGPCTRPLAEDRDRNRVLKIGYLSGDFYEHVVADSVEGVLPGHSRENVHVTCYQLQAKSDHKTNRLKELSDEWVVLAGSSTDDMVAKIRNDKIDILIELGGHTQDCRLDVVARCPAPVLVSWMGYPNTTGVDCIDYRITDAVCDPVESTQIYSEQLVRLSTFFHSLSKQDILDIPVGPAPPIIANGHVTFGSFNNLMKHSDRTKACWAKVLLALPTSKLMLKAKVFGHAADKKHWENKFIEVGLQGAVGVNFKTSQKLRKQLMLVPTTRIGDAGGYKEHINMYNDMDIMLDSWPYGGTTTTTEAILMGVPLVTMAVEGADGCHSQNVGASMLKQIGLSDLVAKNEEQFLHICVNLANNPERLQQIKKTLRDTCLETICKPVADGLCREVEQEFRKMWHAYIDSTS